MDLKELRKHPKLVVRLLDCFDGYGLITTDQELLKERAVELDYEEILTVGSDFNKELDNLEQESLVVNDFHRGIGHGTDRIS